MLYFFNYSYTNLTLMDFGKKTDSVLLDLIDYIKAENDMRGEIFERYGRPFLTKKLADSKTTAFDVLVHSEIFDEIFNSNSS